MCNQFKCVQHPLFFLSKIIAKVLSGKLKEGRGVFNLGAYPLLAANVLDL